MRLRATAALLSLFVAALPAAAATRSVIVSAGDMGEAAVTAAMPDGVTTFVGMTVLLPADFKKDSKASLRFNVMTGGAANCSFTFGGDTVRKLRPGVAAVNGPPQNMGIPASGLADIALQPNVPRVVSYVVQGLTTGPIRGMHKGDILNITFKRIGSALNDTCGTVSIQLVEFRYLTP